MKGPVIIDTGPLVAFLNRRERHHHWAREQFAQTRPPMFTCEAVITETSYLVRDLDTGINSLMKLIKGGVVATRFSLADEHSAVTRLIEKYASLPMSFADACLVRMSEQFPTSTVLTIDNDFRIYRRNGRMVIPTIMPK